MNDAEWTSVRISRGILRKLGEIAAANRRSLTGQLEWLVEIEHKKFRVASTEILPRPLDGQAVPVVTVIPEE